MNRLSKVRGKVKGLLLLLLLVVSHLTYAQYETPEEAPLTEEQLNAALNPPAATPINDWVGLMMFAGVVAGWYLIRRRKEVKAQ
jgi:hypothetical protein